MAENWVSMCEDELISRSRISKTFVFNNSPSSRAYHKSTAACGIASCGRRRCKRERLLVPCDHLELEKVINAANIEPGGVLLEYVHSCSLARAQVAPDRHKWFR